MLHFEKARLGWSWAVTYQVSVTHRSFSPTFFLLLLLSFFLANLYEVLVDLKLKFKSSNISCGDANVYIISGFFFVLSDVNVTKPDKKSVLMYVTSMYKVLSTQTPLIREAEHVVDNVVTSQTSISLSRKSARESVTTASPDLVSNFNPLLTFDLRKEIVTFDLRKVTLKMCCQNMSLWMAMWTKNTYVF